MTFKYRLVGYDRTTEFLEASYDVPAGKQAAVRLAAGLKPTVATMLGDWPLADEAARTIAQLIGQEIDLARMEFFLEPSAAADRRHRSGA
jgi:hypothetical protein